MNAVLKATIRTVDVAFKRIERTRKPAYWCSNCVLALYADEVVQIPLPAEQGCRGATTLMQIECGCGCEVEDYHCQDEADEVQS